MANPQAVVNWLDDCKAIAEEALSLGLETSKLVHAWQVVDKLRMDDMVQSMYHLGWSLTDISENIDEIARSQIKAERKYTVEEIQYEDATQLAVDELEARTIAWYTDIQNFHQILLKMVLAVKGVGFFPRTIALLTNRIRLDLEFFERQYKKSGGRLL